MTGNHFDTKTVYVEMELVYFNQFRYTELVLTKHPLSLKPYYSPTPFNHPNPVLAQEIFILGVKSFDFGSLLDIPCSNDIPLFLEH